MLVCFDAELRRTGTIPLKAADGKHADLVLAQPLSAALREARERHTKSFKTVTPEQTYQTAPEEPGRGHGSQGPWPSDTHKSISLEQPGASISSLRQHTIPKDAPDGLRAVPKRCDLTGNNAAVDAHSPATWLPEGYDLEVNAALPGTPGPSVAVDFQYHFTQTQAPDTGLGLQGAPVFPACPSVPPLPQQPNWRSLKENLCIKDRATLAVAAPAGQLKDLVQAASAAQHVCVANAASTDPSTTGEALLPAEEQQWAAPDVPAGVISFASGQRAGVSAEAHAIVRKLLANWGVDHAERDPPHQIPTPPEQPAGVFRFANGRSTTISAAGESRARALLADTQAEQPLPPPAAGLFSFASGRPAQPTAAGQARAARLIKELLLEGELPAVQPGSPPGGGRDQGLHLRRRPASAVREPSPGVLASMAESQDNEEGMQVAPSAEMPAGARVAGCGGSRGTGLQQPQAAGLEPEGLQASLGISTEELAAFDRRCAEHPGDCQAGVQGPGSQPDECFAAERERAAVQKGVLGMGADQEMHPDGSAGLGQEQLSRKRDLGPLRRNGSPKCQRPAASVSPCGQREAGLVGPQGSPLSSAAPADEAESGLQPAQGGRTLQNDPVPEHPPSATATASSKPADVQGKLEQVISLEGPGAEPNPAQNVALPVQLRAVARLPEAHPSSAQPAERRSDQPSGPPRQVAESRAFQLTTASGKPVAMANGRLAAAAALFGEDFFASDNGPAGADQQKGCRTLPAEEPGSKEAAAGSEPFQLMTASGKAVTLPRGGLARAAALFDFGDPSTVGTAAACQQATGSGNMDLPRDVAAADSDIINHSGGASVGPQASEPSEEGHLVAAVASPVHPTPARTPAVQVCRHGLGAGAAIGRDSAKLPPSRLGPVGRGALSSGRRSRSSRLAAPRNSRKFEPPTRRLGAIQGGMHVGNGGTTPRPSRLQTAGNAGMSAKPHVPLHSMKDSLFTKVLADKPEASGGPCLRTATSSPNHLFSLELSQEDGGCSRAEPQSMLESLMAAGAEAGLVQEPWVANSLRWVLWKLASAAQQWPALSRRLLSHAVILDELKKRYEWELNQGHQPVLKRVLEQDESPSRLMILCVAAIRPPKTSNADVQLELTDGWYAVRTVVDDPLAALVAQGKLQLGDRLRILGAEISAGGQQSEALEAAKSTFLRIHYNGTHRMPHSTQLGRPPHRTVLVPLPCVKPGGGGVPRMVVLLQRKYPPYNWQRTSDGRAAVLTPKAHAAALRKADSCAAKIEEHVSAQIQAEEVARCKAQLAQAAEKASTPSGERLYAEAVVSGGEQLGSLTPLLERHVAHRQVAMQAQRQQRLSAEMQRAGCEAQSARSCRNLLISAVLHQEKSGSGSDMEAVIKVWGASDDVDYLTEGRLYIVTYLSPSNSRRARLELHTTKSTQWQEYTPGPTSQLLFDFRPRVVATLATIATVGLGHSLDFEGVVLGVSDLNEGDSQSSQWLFLADASVRGSEDWLLAVQLKAGPQAIDYLDPAQDAGRYVSLKDLRMEGQDTQNSVWQAAGTENSSIAFLQPPRGKPAAGATDTAKLLAEWSRNSKELQTTLQFRIQRLFGGNQERQ